MISHTICIQSYPAKCKAKGQLQRPGFLRPGIIQVCFIQRTSKDQSNTQTSHFMSFPFFWNSLASYMAWYQGINCCGSSCMLQHNPIPSQVSVQGKVTILQTRPARLHHAAGREQAHSQSRMQQASNHRENCGTLGMVPLIINPIYTLYSGFLYVFIG